MAWIIVLVVVGVIALWAILAYNGLVTLKHQVDNAWKQIDVQLKRRYDLIPNLVSAVRGSMEFEKATLERVMDARAKAMGARSVHDKGAAEGLLSGALGGLFALFENYPDLKSSANALELQEELASTENRIGFARQFYNDLAAGFNIRQSVFPTMIIASLFGFRKAEYFQAGPEAATPPKVDLGMK